jgi:Fe-S-cluster containining protein
VPVSTQDITSSENFWEITAHENLPEVVIERFLRPRRKPGSCAFLNGKIRENVACTIYETRPTTCREFEAGSDRCHAFRRMYKLEEPLTESEISQADIKLQQDVAAQAEKISSATIVAEEIENERVVMIRLPDNTFSVVKEKNTEVICKIHVFFNDSPPLEIHSYNPSEESWLQHQFFGLTLTEARNLISNR